MRVWQPARRKIGEEESSTTSRNHLINRQLETKAKRRSQPPPPPTCKMRTALPADVESNRRAAAVQDDQHDRAIRILKGYILQVPLLPGVRSDPVGARSNKFAGVGQGGEIHGGRDFGRRKSSIDFNHPTTVTAPAEVRLMILIEGQVPQDYTLRPVPNRFNNEPNL